MNMKQSVLSGMGVVVGLGIFVMSTPAQSQEMNYYRIYEGITRISGAPLKVELKINDRVMTDDSSVDAKTGEAKRYLDTSVREGDTYCKGAKLDLSSGELALCSGLKLVLQNSDQILKGTFASGSSVDLQGVLESANGRDQISKIILNHTADQAGDHEGGIDD
jgi:hypothetical protein